MSELYLITGGAGFIGSNIAERLVKDGQKVRVIDNLSTGKVENMDSFIDEAEFVHGDIRYLNTVMEAMRDVDYVIHQAALPSVPRSVETPIESNDNNTNGTLNILYAAKENNVKRVVYAASSSAYGESPTLPKVETMIPSPLSPYAVNKLIGEYYCSVFSTVYNLKTVALRYFNVFGPRQDPTSYYSAVIPKFIKAMLEGTQPTIFGDGEQSRDFTFVDNVVEANLLACQAKDVGGKVFNIASGKRYRLLDLVQRIKDLLGADVEPIFADRRRGDVVHSLADISKAERELSYRPTIPFPKGLERTIPYIDAS